MATSVRSGAPMLSSSCDFHLSRAIVEFLLEMIDFLSSTQLCLFMPSGTLSPSPLGTLSLDTFLAPLGEEEGEVTM